MNHTERTNERNAPMLANVAFIWTFSFYVYIFSLCSFQSKPVLVYCVCLLSGVFIFSIVECFTRRFDFFRYTCVRLLDDDDDDDDEVEKKYLTFLSDELTCQKSVDSYINNFFEQASIKGLIGAGSLFEVCKCVLNFYYSRRPASSSCTAGSSSQSQLI